ncbi:MAG: acyltransferase [Ignavibacteria bacterium]|jgi:peptidoglycan/LPS O-acetylase OafA/YrhL|nr:acyltransferase [Ignavibacteria bacterium]MCU7514271.1 acyltransferase [Ignavibacteria bacterium]MCU7526619.1 acyltransferase [Ignavibacteria bacterium]
MEKIKSYNTHDSGIDIFRGLAVLSVILLHLNIRIPFSGTFLGSMMPKPIYSIFFWSGYYGVCTFFVISGFLITKSALNKWSSLPKVSLRGFYTMRIARVMPMLLSLLFVLSLLHFSGIEEFVINPAKTSLGRAIFAALTFHINWLEIQVGYLPGPWDILWSLSIEEFFYFFFPIVCFFCRKEWHFVALVSVFLIISPFARTTWYPGNELADKNHFAYLDAISLGCIAALVSRRIELKKNALLIMKIAGWLLFGLVFFFRKWVYSIGITSIGLNVSLLAIGAALILICMNKSFSKNPKTPSKFTEPLLILGRNSYEIYLTHIFIVISFVYIFDSMKLSGEWIWALYISVIVLSAILGNLIAQYFSNPVNLIIRKRSNIKFAAEKASLKEDLPEEQLSEEQEAR